MLDRHAGGVERRHDGRIAVDERNRRWCCGHMAVQFCRLSRIEGRSGDKIPTAKLTVPVTLQAVVRVRAVRALRHESMSSLQLDLRASRMLLADWFARLAGEAGLQLDQYGSSGEAFTLGAPTGLNRTAPDHSNRMVVRPGRSRAPRYHLVRVSLAREGGPAASGFDPGGAGRELWGSFGARRSKPLAAGVGR